jgi:deoxyribose-phosphate aldolase
MITEFSFYDLATSDDELKEILKDTSLQKIDAICVFLHHIKLVRNSLSENIKISTPIDYPLGVSDTKTRLFSIESAIKSGANIINVVAQPYYFCNRKYEKFRDEIKHTQDLCIKNNVELRYILEYRLFTYELLYKVAQIFLVNNIKTIYPSTGYLLDDINDNILAAALINKKVPQINIICNGNVWNTGQVHNIQKTNLYGIKVNSINALKLLQENR